MRRAILAWVLAAAACGSGDGGTTGTDLAADAPGADVPPPVALSLAVSDDYGAPAAGKSEVDLKVAFGAARDLVVRCTRDGEPLPGVGVTFSFSAASSRLVLSAATATSGDGGLARVTATWAPDATCGDRVEDTVRACLESDPGTCLQFHLWTGRGDAPMLTVEVAGPASGPAVDAVKVHLFRPGDDGKPACVDLKPLALPTATTTSSSFAPGTSAVFKSVPGATTTPSQTWTVLALGTKGAGSPLTGACQDAVRTSDCDQVLLKMVLAPLPVY